jgi:hypothetical protein
MDERRFIKFIDWRVAANRSAVAITLRAECASGQTERRFPHPPSISHLSPLLLPLTASPPSVTVTHILALSLLLVLLSAWSSFIVRPWSVVMTVVGVSYVTISVWLPLQILRGTVQYYRSVVLCCAVLRELNAPVDRQTPPPYHHQTPANHASRSLCSASPGLFSPVVPCSPSCARL